MSNLPDNYDHAAFVAAYEGEAPTASHELRTLGALAGLLTFFTGNDDALDQQLYDAANECATADDPSSEIIELLAEVDYSKHPEAAVTWLTGAVAAKRKAALRRAVAA
jgi:hypothetical protein